MPFPSNLADLTLIVVVLFKLEWVMVWAATLGREDELSLEWDSAY